MKIISKLLIILFTLSMPLNSYALVVGYSRVAGGGDCTGTGTVGFFTPSAGAGTAQSALHIDATAGSDVCITNAYIHVPDSFTSSDHLRVVVWDNGGSVLGISNEITGTSTDTVLSSTFPTSFQLGNGTLYRVGWIADGVMPYWYTFGGTLSNYVGTGYTSYPTATGITWTFGQSNRQIEVYVTGE